jgi:hypothetical protein
MMSRLIIFEDNFDDGLPKKLERTLHIPGVQQGRRNY